MAALFFGLPLSSGMVVALLLLIPAAVMFIGFGLLLGCIFNDKQVGGIASILIMLVSFLGGMWFDLDLMGSAYKTVATLLPFSHAVEVAKAPLAGNYDQLLVHLLWTVVYAVLVFALAIFTFKGKMQSDNK